MVLSSWWRDVWRGDRSASDLRMQGEHRVAQSRFVLIGVLTLTGLAVVAVDPGNQDYRRAVPLTVICLTLAFLALLATRRGNGPPWFAFVTAVADVSLISLLHVFDLLQGAPSMAVNGRITFMGYFLVLIGTAVRWDTRLPWVIGGVAAAQYAGIAAWGASIWPALPTPDVIAYGQFDWGVQLERVVTLLLFAGLSASIAKWAAELRSTATNDALTGLLNRRAFEERLQSELTLARRRGEPLTFVMIDADHFKRVNDGNGHEAGDQALKEISARIRNLVRRTDLVARWGGEEFAIAFPNAPAVRSAAKIERLRAEVEATPIRLPDGTTIRVTISAGIASTEEDGADDAALIRLADERLLQAKRAGRNRVTSAAAATPEPASATATRHW